ncbi:hypothetical protein LZ32DRAFT_71562 [Colletotrichum eremochloae]|nr:hypothetical protein LZ32DRAFT_71562 [Colletotrichum eremochloae]
MLSRGSGLRGSKCPSGPIYMLQRGIETGYVSRVHMMRVNGSGTQNPCPVLSKATCRIVQYGGKHVFACDCEAQLKSLAKSTGVKQGHLCMQHNARFRGTRVISWKDSRRGPFVSFPYPLSPTSASSPASAKLRCRWRSRVVHEYFLQSFFTLCAKSMMGV